VGVGATEVTRAGRRRPAGGLTWTAGAIGLVVGLGLAAVAFAGGAPLGALLAVGTTLGVGLIVTVSRQATRGPKAETAAPDAPATPAAAERREQRLEALLEVSTALGPVHRVEALFETVAGACARLFDSDSVAYRVLEGEDLVLAGTWGHAGDAMLAKRVRLGESVSGRVALTGEPMLVRDPESDPRVIPEHRKAAQELGHHGLLGVPVKIAERLVGVLIIRTRRAGGFTPEDLSIAAAFASQVAIAMENARLYEHLARANDQRQFLFEAARQATVSLSLADVLSHLVKWGTELTEASASSIRLLDPSETALEPVASYGVSDRFSQRGPVMAQGSRAQAILGGHPIVVADFIQEPGSPFQEEALAEGLRSMVCVPLRSRDRVIGSFSVYTRAPRSFSDDEVAFFAEFANLAAISIENARLYHRTEERTEKLTTLSSLTRLINSAGDSEAVFNAVAMAAATLLEARISHVWIDDPDSLALALRGRYSVEAEHELLPNEISLLPYKSGVETAIFESRIPEYLPDALEDPRWVNPELVREQGLRGWAGVPMIAQGVPVGVLSVYCAERRQFSAADREILTLLADQAAIAIENRRSAELMRTAYSQTEQLLSSISWILIVVDEYDTITQWNEAAETTFGIPAGKVVGWPLVDCGIDCDWEWMLERIAEARERETPTRFDAMRYRRDGRDRFLGITLTPIKGAPGQHSGFMLLGSDITERKTLETQLAQAQRLEGIGRLAAGVAHEINTPIQFVGDNTRFLQTAFDDLHRLLQAYQALRDHAKGGSLTPALVGEVERAEQETDVEYLVAEIPKAVGQTLDGVTRVATIVQALKEFAHPNQKEKVPTDLNQALQSTLSVARNEIKYVADVEAEFGDLPLVVCQPGELNQVFLNLIVNAAHAIADVVKDSGSKGVIRVRTAREDDMALVAISDTGCGIPEGHRAQIFDPFFTTKEVGRGTGQGLSIAHAVVVDKHGGSLTFETEVGRGTTFFVRLPLAGAEAGDPA
jgi:PAS domain S-box-containing protein